MGIIMTCIIILSIIFTICFVAYIIFGINPLTILGEFVETLADCDFDFD